MESSTNCLWVHCLVITLDRSRHSNGYVTGYYYSSAWDDSSSACVHLHCQIIFHFSFTLANIVFPTAYTSDCLAVSLCNIRWTEPADASQSGAFHGPDDVSNVGMACAEPTSRANTALTSSVMYIWLHHATGPIQKLKKWRPCIARVYRYSTVLYTGVVCTSTCIIPVPVYWCTVYYSTQ